MDDSFFRTLNKEEEKQFRDWARKNWHFGMEVNEMWHPCVRDEIRLIVKEIGEQDRERMK
jgi:hypothetical protein